MSHLGKPGHGYDVAVRVLVVDPEVVPCAPVVLEVDGTPVLVDDVVGVAALVQGVVLGARGIAFGIVGLVVRRALAAHVHLLGHADDAEVVPHRVHGVEGLVVGDLGRAQERVAHRDLDRGDGVAAEPHVEPDELGVGGPHLLRGERQVVGRSLGKTLLRELLVEVSAVGVVEGLVREPDDGPPLGLADAGDVDLGGVGVGDAHGVGRQVPCFLLAVGDVGDLAAVGVAQAVVVVVHAVPAGALDLVAQVAALAAVEGHGLAGDVPGGLVGVERRPVVGQEQVLRPVHPHVAPLVPGPLRVVLVHHVELLARQGVVALHDVEVLRDPEGGHGVLPEVAVGLVVVGARDDRHGPVSVQEILVDDPRDPFQGPEGRGPCLVARERPIVAHPVGLVVVVHDGSDVEPFALEDLLVVDVGLHVVAVGPCLLAAHDARGEGQKKTAECDP
jgi:hypothetical protein